MPLGGEINDGAGMSGGPSSLVARNAALRTAGELVAKLASVAFFVAVARELGEGGFGDFTFALSFTTVLLLAAGFGTEELIAREVAREQSTVHRYLTDVMAIKAALSVALLLIAAGIVNAAGYPADVRLAVYLIGVGVALEGMGRTWHAVFQAFERMEFISISLVLQRFATAIAGIVVLLAGGGLIAVSLVMLGGSLLGFAVGAWALRRYVVKPRLDVDRSRWRGLMKAGIPIGLVGVLMIGLVKVDQTLLSFLSEEPGNTEVGYFGAAFRLVEATMFVGWAFSSALLPWFSRHEESLGGSSLARGYELGLKATATVLVPVGLSFVLLADPLIDLFYGERYESAVEPLRLLGAMVFLLGLNEIAAALLIARDRPLVFARAVAVVGVFNVVLNVLLIPRYGASGAAFTALLSAVILAGLGLIVVRPLTGELRLVRSFGAAIAGAGAMAAAVLPFDLPLMGAGLIGTVSYVAGCLTFERIFFPEDFRTFLGMVRRRRSTPVEVA